MKPPGKGPLMINALIWPELMLILLLAITMGPVATIMVPVPLDLPAARLSLPHYASGNYREPADMEAFAGLTGYTRDYYGAASAAASAAAAAGNSQPTTLNVGIGGDLAQAPYANYVPEAVSGVDGTASGFVQSYNSRLQQSSATELESEARQQRGKIDFAINAANYEQQPPAIYYQSYAYQPRASIPGLSPMPPQRDYHIEQYSNYHHAARDRQQEQEIAMYRQESTQSRQAQTSNGFAYASGQQHDRAIDVPVQRQHHQQQQHQQEQHQLRAKQLTAPQPYQEDQQLLYSHSEGHIADLPQNGRLRNTLPPITTSVHHTQTSSKAIAGLPLAKHIEVTKHLPVTHYQQQHVPYRQTVHVRVPRPIIAAIPKPIPIKVPVSRTVAVPQVQEVKIPVEKLKPVPVERPVPFVVERRVPYRVEKPVATPFYYPYPVKVPVVRTVVHKQPHHTPGLNSYGGWPASNHLLV